MADTIKLTGVQETHVDTIVNRIFPRSPHALDLSMMGAGKTYTALHIAKQFDGMVLVAPKAVLTKWAGLAQKYGVNLITSLSWQQMAGCASRKDASIHTISHPYLRASTFVDEKNVRHVEFFPTPEWRRLCESRMLLVMDEFQNIKNPHTHQTLAGRALLSTMSGESKSLLLSGSPIDKYEHINTVLRNIGILSSSRITVQDPSTNTTVWKGATEVREFARAIDPVAESEVYGSEEVKDGYRSVDAQKYINKVFLNIIKGYVSSEMPVPANVYKIEKYSALIPVEDQDESKTIADHVADLNDMQLRYNTEKTQGSALKILAMINKILKELEHAKVMLFVRTAKRMLEQEPNRHVCICVNYTDTLARIKDELSAYAPVVLQGCMTLEQRADSITKFCAPNTDHRVCICNIKVASVGICLDDKYGQFPRTALVSPNYDTINQYQLGHRFMRMDTASDAVLYFVFAEHAHESRVLNSLKRKGGVMKEVSEKQSAAGVQFPGSYEEIRIVG